MTHLEHLKCKYCGYIFSIIEITATTEMITHLENNHKINESKWIELNMWIVAQTEGCNYL